MVKTRSKPQDSSPSPNPDSDGDTPPTSRPAQTLSSNSASRPNSSHPLSSAKAAIGLVDYSSDSSLGEDEVGVESGGGDVGGAESPSENGSGGNTTEESSGDDSDDDEDQGKVKVELGRGKRPRKPVKEVPLFGEGDGDLESDVSNSGSGYTSEADCKPKPKKKAKGRGKKEGSEGGETAEDPLDADSNVNALAYLGVSWNYWAEEPGKRGNPVNITIKGPDHPQWLPNFTIGKFNYRLLWKHIVCVLQAAREFTIIGDSIKKRMTLPESDRQALELVGWIKKSRDFPVSRPAHLSIDEERWEWIAAVVAAQDSEESEVGVTFRALHKANATR
ncbi:hypothetical protein P7C70_g9497, partial [Phenoliferia sp. Uapishka_3]